MITYFKIGFLAVLFFSLAFTEGGKEELQRRPASDGSVSGTETLDSLIRLSAHYRYTIPDSALYYGKQALSVSRKMALPGQEALVMLTIAKAYYVQGSYQLSLDYSTRALKISEKTNDLALKAEAINNSGLIYLAQEKYRTAIAEFRRSARINKSLKKISPLAANYINLAICYDELAIPDSALLYARLGEQIADSANNHSLEMMAVNRIGEIYFHTGDYRKAEEYYKKVLSATKSAWELSFANTGLARTLYSQRRYAEAVPYAYQGLEHAREIKVKWDASRASRILSDAYAALYDYQNAYKYYTLHKRYDDSLFSEAKEKEINYLHLQQKLTENRRLEHQNHIKEQEIKFNKFANALVSLVALLTVLLAGLIYRNSRKQRLLNIQLEKKNADIAVRNRKIEQQNAELSRLNHTKDQLFSILSHDLRGPLASVQQAVGLLKEGAFDESEQEMMFNDFHRQIIMVNNMINNMLNWASGQQRGIETHAGVTDLSAVAGEVLALYESLAANKGIHLVQEYKDPVWILADPDHLRIIIQNIAGNAIKFTQPGGSVFISIEESDDCCEFHIRDTGIGISPEKMEQLFKVFGRSISGYGTASESGAGLGLMLIKQFTEANNGHVEVRSHENEGTEFIVWFKKADPADGGPVLSDSRQIDPVAGSGSGV